MTEYQLNNYGCFHEPPHQEQLEKYFYLNDADHELLVKLRYDHTRLGFAVQLGTLRFLGCFLENITETPTNVILFVAKQLELKARVDLKPYIQAVNTKFAHQKIICEALGYKEFSGAERLHLLRFLYARVLLADERPMVLFDLATKKLVERKVILPGATTISRYITSIRERITTRQHRLIASQVSRAMRERLDTLLIVKTPEKERRTPLEILRTPPSRVSSHALNAGLHRIKEIRAVGVGNISLEQIPESRMLSMARQLEGLWAKTLLGFAEERRYASLVVFMQYLERTATDDVLEIFGHLMNSLGLQGKKVVEKQHLQNHKKYSQAARILGEVAQMVCNQDITATKLRTTVLQKYPIEQIQQAITDVSELVQDDLDDEVTRWQKAIGVVGVFIRNLLTTLEFQATPAGQPVLEGINYLVRIIGVPDNRLPEPPDEFVTQRWKDMVFPNGQLERPLFAVYLAKRLHEALSNRSVFVVRSYQFADPRAKLLDLEAWSKVKGEVLAAISLPEKGAVFLQRLEQQLDATVSTVLEGVESIRFEEIEGVLTPVPERVEALEVPPTLKELVHSLNLRLPEIDLPELILEIEQKTGFGEAILEASATKPRSANWKQSLVAVLFAKATNVGISKIKQHNHPALNAARLSYVQQNLFHREALLQANAKIIEYHRQLPLTKHFGDGEVASADGLRFLVPIHSPHTAPNPKYFGMQRGITFYTLTSDQYTMLHGIVVAGTLHDSLNILATVLEQRTVLQPTEIMSDTHGYSDAVFGLFHLLGYTFSPRLRDLKDRLYWRINPNTDYKQLNAVTKHKIKKDRILEQWEDICRLVGSLKLGAVKANDVIRVLVRGASLSGLGHAVSDIGRIAKTMYMLRYVSDGEYRRRILTQLNRGEARGQIGRHIFFGNKGDVHQKYRHGMEDQLTAMGIVVNLITLWNTLYMQRALSQLEAEGLDVLDSDIAHLSPLRYEHINVLGKYSFELSKDVQDGDFRPLREPFDFSKEWLEASLKE
jgi:TnpA family transposase